MEKHIISYDEFTGNDCDATKLQAAAETVHIDKPEDVVEAEEKVQELEDQIADAGTDSISTGNRPAGIEMTDSNTNEEQSIQRNPKSSKRFEYIDCYKGYQSRNS